MRHTRIGSNNKILLKSEQKNRYSNNYNFIAHRFKYYLLRKEKMHEWQLLEQYFRH